jgi:hypothetical protein
MSHANMKASSVGSVSLNSRTSSTTDGSSLTARPHEVLHRIFGLSVVPALARGVAYAAWAAIAHQAAEPESRP